MKLTPRSPKPPKCCLCSRGPKGHGRSRVPVSRYKIEGDIYWIHPTCKRALDRDGTHPTEADQ